MNISELLSQLTLEEKASLCAGADSWRTRAVPRLGIPAVMMSDGPHGLRKQRSADAGTDESIETVCYPTASALASSFDTRLLADLGTVLGQECQAENVQMLLGPAINMKRSPLCGRNFEYFSEDPYLAGSLAAAYIQALQAQGVAACVKHFACNNQETHRFTSSSNLSRRALHEIYLPAFEMAVKEGKTRSVMSSYNQINGTFASENSMLLTKILRERWGFSGMVVSDWGAVHNRVPALAAGLDLQMPGPGTPAEEIVAAVQEGRLAQEDLDKAVANILGFVSDSLEARRPDTAIDREQNSRLSGEMEDQCAVLLKNDGVLPLNREQKVLFLGDLAAQPRYQGGGSSHINVPHPVSALEALGEVPYARGYTLEETEGPELLSQAVSLAREADAVVIFAGLPDSYETEGADRAHMALPENQNALIEAVARVNRQTVVVLHGGSPMELPWADEVAGILCMYLGGEQVGPSARRILYGEVNPSGKLAESWPLKLAHNPSYLNFPDEDGQVHYREDIFIGYRYYDKKELPVRFPFGHGLSYTAFTYSDLRLSRPAITDKDTLTVTCRVTNTGTRAGREAVQLYVRNAPAPCPRPVRELRGFEKVLLQPGESAVLTFRLSARAFACYAPQVEDFLVPSGKYGIEIAASSRDIRLSAPVEVTATRELPVFYTPESPVGDLQRTPRGRRALAELLNHPTIRSQVQGAEALLGEGSGKMVQQMFLNMSLNDAVRTISLPAEETEAFLKALNGETQPE